MPKIANHCPNYVPDTQSVIELRKKVLSNLEDCQNEIYSDDIERLKRDEEFCQRFLVHQKLLHPNDDALELGIKMAKNEFKWRKEFGIKDIKRDTLPQEFFDRQVIVPFNRDKKGCCTVILRAKMVRRTSSSEKRSLEEFVAYWIESVESINPGEMFTIIVDCTGAGLSNANMDLLTMLVHMIKDHYLAIVGDILVLNLPTLLVATWKVIKYLLPQAAVEKVKFMDTKGILDYIDADKLPPSMGGTDTRDLSFTPFVFAERDPIKA